MPDQDSDVNAAILAELKQMNESLSYIKTVAQRLNDQQNRKAQALADMKKFSAGLPRLD